MRILFAGSPMIAVPSLRVLSELEMKGKGIFLAGVLTNPDSKRGRSGRKEATDLSIAALELDRIRKEKDLVPIPQLKPEKLDAAARREVAALEADILVSFAYGSIFGPRFLALFPQGGINVHPSLLPKYRGASPIPAVILGREKETGICIQKLAAELDAGDILAEDRFTLSGRETTASLGEITGLRAARLLESLLLECDSVFSSGRPQKNGATYCSEIKKEAGVIDWNRSAAEIDAQIRAYTPWPLSFTRCGTDTLIILEAEPFEETPKKVPGTVLGTDERGILIQTGDGILAVTRLQWRTKKALDWKVFCNGARGFIGSQLG